MSTNKSVLEYVASAHCILN